MRQPLSDALRPLYLTIKVFEIEEFTPQAPDSLNEFLTMLRKAVDTVPVEHRDRLRLCLSHGTKYNDDTRARLTLHYTRPETALEVAQRLESRTEAGKKRAAEIAELRRLRALYPDEA